MTYWLYSKGQRARKGPHALATCADFVVVFLFTTLCLHNIYVNAEEIAERICNSKIIERPRQLFAEAKIVEFRGCGGQ